jgi:6-phosphogluconate dehydrogenase
MTTVYVVMGVSGCGKSTVGEALAASLACPFYDGDHFHSAENVAKMASGTPLNDDDRAPWLATLHDLLADHLARNQAVVLACSALKKRYRDQLRGGSDGVSGSDGVTFVYLQGDFELIWQRMQARSGHYMQAEMLQSQFDTLEPPDANEAIIVSVAQSVDSILEQIKQRSEVKNLLTVATRQEETMTQQADIGLIGLAVMGQNLVLNMDDHGYTVAVFNRTTSKVDRFIENEAQGTKVIGTHSLEELVSVLKRPRRVMIMVKAGWPVDATIESLVPLLEEGDIIIDGGNSHFPDSTRRTRELAEKGILFIGTGVSGGEEGARFGPSIMPGGAPEAWPHVKPIFQAIAAKVADGTPCCDWVGEEGAGHFVKMVHNGIEYGDMQLICEAYDVLQHALGMTAGEMSTVFADWNTGKLDSYLIEITADILAYNDEDNRPMVDNILDTAGQKGTGKWTAVAALDQGIPLTLIGEAVFSRFLSALKDERVVAAGLLGSPTPAFTGDRAALIADLQEALFASKIVSYTQGYMLMRAMSVESNWNLSYGAIALMWRGGCIIRAAFLEDIKAAYDADPNLSNLLLAPFFKAQIQSAEAAWRRVIGTAVALGIPVPAMSSALAFYDGYRRERLPANLLQAQRDYFGAHTYERLDKPRGEFFHTNWTGEGGDITASTYDA